MTKLEVRSECQSLNHGDVSPRLEHHHGNRLAREGISDDEFGDDIETNCLVGDSRNDSDGNDVDECNGL